MPDEMASTHWSGCWRSHPACAHLAVPFLAEGAEVLMLDALDCDPEDPNALEMKHRLHLHGFNGSGGSGGLE